MLQDGNVSKNLSGIKLWLLEYQLVLQTFEISELRSHTRGSPNF